MEVAAAPPDCRARRIFMSDDADIEAKIAAALRGLGATCEVIRIDPDFADTAAFCESTVCRSTIRATPSSSARRRGRRSTAPCLVLATTRLDVNHGAPPHGRFASLVRHGRRDEGSHGHDDRRRDPARPLPPAVPIYVDERIMALDYVILSGSRSSKLKLSPDLLRRLPSLTVVPDLALAAS